MDSINRRHFLSFVGAGLATPFVVLGSKAHGLSFLNSAKPTFNSSSEEVFPYSVASGDPTPSGFMLWTRINPSVWSESLNLDFEVAEDEDFSSVVFSGRVNGSDIGSDRDYTVKLDLDNQLESNRYYFYRFFYNGTVSRTGRARTSPAYGAPLDSLKFAMVTCQDYTNGYYDAFRHLAEDESIDYVLHLGDFIYETAGDPRFQALPFEDRLIILPSDGLVAMDLADYRTLYQNYRSDKNLQLAMERHTFIITTDDHETANDCYWDYENDTLGAPDHPYHLDNNLEALYQLKLDSQQAWLEYTPTRVHVDWDATHPHQFSKIYRQFSFGDMVDLFVLDTRTYRTPHPCGEGDVLERYVPLGCTNFDNPDQSLLGNEQKDWLVNGLAASSTRWKVLGNQTFMGRLGVELGQFKLPINVDAWDGFWAERSLLMNEVKSNDVGNFIVLTGDLHTHMASNVKVNYADVNPLNENNYVGAEFMTPSVTSAGLIDMISSLTGIDIPASNQKVLEDISTFAVRALNPHVRFFDSFSHGYSTVEFNNEFCEWQSFIIDKNAVSGTEKIPHARYRKYEEYPWILKKKPEA